MSDIVAQLRALLDAASNASAQQPIPVDLVFDDEPLDAILYGAPTTGPTRASIFQAAREIFTRICEAEARSDYREAMELVEQLRSEDRPLPLDIESRLAHLLQSIAGASLESNHSEAVLESLGRLAQNDLRVLVALAFTSHARREFDQCRKLWQIIAEAHAKETAPEDVFHAIVPPAALDYWRADPNRFPGLARLLVEISLQPGENDSGVAPDSHDETQTIIDQTAVNGLRRLATRYQAEGQGYLFEHLLEQIIVAAVTANVAGAEHQAVATCLNQLVRSLQDQGEHEAAITLGRRALSIRVFALGEHHPVVAQSLNNLGLSLVCVNEFEEAEDLLDRAARVRLEFPNPHYWLGRLYQARAARGDLEKEAAAWQRYLYLGPTTPERDLEARRRLSELAR